LGKSGLAGDCARTAGRALTLGTGVLVLDARVVKRPRQRPGGPPANALAWCCVRPMSANRTLAAEGRTARASGESEMGGSARNGRRSPADERPALTVGRGLTAAFERYE